MKRGRSGESPKASRTSSIAWSTRSSKSTRVLAGQSFSCNSSRVTTRPGCSASISRTCKALSCSLIPRPCFRNSPSRKSTSKSSNRATRGERVCGIVSLLPAGLAFRSVTHQRAGAGTGLSSEIVAALFPASAVSSRTPSPTTFARLPFSITPASPPTSSAPGRQRYPLFTSIEPRCFRQGAPLRVPARSPWPRNRWHDRRTDPPFAPLRALLRLS